MSADAGGSAAAPWRRVAVSLAAVLSAAVLGAVVSDGYSRLPWAADAGVAKPPAVTKQAEFSTAVAGAPGEARLRLGLGFQVFQGEVVTPSAKVQLGNRLSIVVWAENAGSVGLTNVRLRIEIPDDTVLADGNPRRYYGQYDGDASATDYLLRGGQNLGTILPDARGYLTFSVQAPSSVSCGESSRLIKLVASVDQLSAPLEASSVMYISRQC